LKILWFQDGIKCTSLDTVNTSIKANHANLSEFDSVKDTYVEFKHTQAPTNDPKIRQVAFVGHGGCRGSSCSCRQRQQTGNTCQKGLVSQAKIDKQTHITLRHSSHDEFKQLNPAKKGKTMAA
jgi:hypothetical protein